MKLNFWQWLGVVLLIVAIGFWINRKLDEREAANAGKPVPGLQGIGEDEDPATAPSAEPTTSPAP